MYSIISGVFGLPYRLASLLIYIYILIGCSQFEHFGDSLRTPAAPLMSPSPVCLSAEGAKNVSGP